MIKILNAQKKFGDQKILDDVNLIVSSGTITGLAGPSGGGKSTLLRVIAGLEKLDAGEMEHHHRVGFMFQDFQLFPHFNVLDNLCYAPKIVLQEKNPEQRAIGMLSLLGMEHKHLSYPHELSGGQKQRVALARSLMMNPDILLCDEPTSGLDVATIQDVVSLLIQVQQMGVTMLIASHDLDFLTKIADRIIILKEGQIHLDLICDDHPDLINKLKHFY